VRGAYSPYVQAAIDGEMAHLASAQSGERNTTLFKASASLASLGLREGEIIRHLKPVAEGIGLRGREFYCTVKSGVKTGHANPRSVPSVSEGGDRILSLSTAAAATDEVPAQHTDAEHRIYEEPFFLAVEDGPAVLKDEERRHVYLKNRLPVRIKIKRRSGRYSNWYRVTKAGKSGWQAGKPDDFVPCPYTGDFDAFDREFLTEPLYWPEGEKDCDTLSRQGLPAFTFGGTGDGLPRDIEPYLKGRHIIILADNDNGGKQHAIEKAERAKISGAASIRLVEFPDVPSKGDVSDFLESNSVKDLEDRVLQTAFWEPSSVPKDKQAAFVRELVTCNLSDIAPERINWIWPGRIAVGKLTLLAGEPGLGKSQVALYVASTITRGAKWVGSHDKAHRGRVLMLSADDGLADTVRPRFDAAGGDPSMVSIIRATRSGPAHGTFNLGADLVLLEREIARHGDVDLVTIDPISSYMLNVDSHKNTDVRSVLEPIGEMAERLKVGILATSHLSKGDGKAINRIIGSIAFVAAARAAFTVVEDPEVEGRRLFLSVKNNIAPPQRGLAFRLEQQLVAPDVVRSFVAWDEDAEVKLTADQVLSGAGEQSSTKSDAVQLLAELLINGPMPVRDIERHAIDASLLAEGKPIGQSKPFRLARAELDIKSRRAGGLAAGGQWVWELPDSKMPSHCYDAQVSDVGTLETFGHLSKVRGSA
jgi:hypothetical protein